MDSPNSISDNKQTVFRLSQGKIATALPGIFLIPVD
jgi:hypothetical protein